MESFLTASKRALLELSLYQTIRVVMGNQTCDLDSTICTLAQGLLEFVETRNCEQNGIAVIPVMNIPENEFRIKTEVVYCLKSHNIPLNLLTFRDQINLHNIQNDANKKLELVLVDHHTLMNEDIKLKSSVIAITDHRPLDIAWTWSNVPVKIETVGSCATLVARNILQKNPDILDAQLSSLLRSPILIDTYNMSEKANVATAIDNEILNILEQRTGLISDRTKIYNGIIDAKADISHLTLQELIIKDLKITSGVPIVGLPLLVENFLMLDNAREAIQTFCFINNYTVIVLIGLNLKTENPSRDIAVFSTLSNQLGHDIINALTTSTQPHLDLELIQEIQDETYNFCLYRQRNLKITRKQILPIVQKMVLLNKEKQEQT